MGRRGRVGRQNATVSDTFRTRGSQRIGLTTQTAGGVIQAVLFGAAAASTTAFDLRFSAFSAYDLGMSSLGAMFTQWKFNSFRINYHAACGQQNGSFVIAISDDPTDTSNSGAYSITATTLTIFRCKRHISVWKDGFLNWRPKNAQTWYYTSGGDASVTDADTRMSNQALLMFATDGAGVGSADGNMGSFDIDYDISFRGRRPLYTSITRELGPPVLHSNFCSTYSTTDHDHDEPSIVISAGEYAKLKAAASGKIS